MTSILAPNYNRNVSTDGPSDYIKNLVRNLYVEGLDPPRKQLKMAIPEPSYNETTKPAKSPISENFETLLQPIFTPEFRNEIYPKFRRQSPHDKSRLQGPKTFSNDMKDCCKHRCRLCNKVYTLTAMRGHCKTIHQMSIKEYQFRYGNVRDMIEVVMWHKCQICNNDFLLDSDEIHKHANIRHKMSLREYTQKFLVLKNRGYIRRDEVDYTASVESPPKIKQELTFFA